MTAIAQAQLGTHYFGRIAFAAATEGELSLSKGGNWPIPPVNLGVSPFYSAVYTVLARQRDVFTVSTVTNSTLYFIVYDGKTYSYTSDGSATAAEIRDGLIAAVLAASPGNGLTAGIVDGTNFYVMGLNGGEYHVRGTASTGAALLTPAAGIETIPANTLFQKQGSVLVRFASAFTGYVDVVLCHK